MKRRTHWVIVAALSLALVVLCLDVGRLVLAPTREASIDAVRIRNAMVAELGRPADTEWPPGTVPADYNWESRSAPAFFTQVVDQVVPPEARQQTALARAVLLARHLSENSKHGNPIQANTRETYRKIVSGQGGYCSDFTRTFMALALADGLQVREWGFSWEDMANGHAFNEVWDPALAKWVFIDSFVSFYVVDAATGTPMSALEFRAALLGQPGAGQPQVEQIAPGHFNFKTVEKALAWYRRGAPRMFMVLGNNVYSYDANPVIRAAEALPRSVEMLMGIVIGEFPKFLFLPPDSQPEVKAQVEQMGWELIWVLVKLAAIAALGIALVVYLWYLLRSRARTKRASQAG